MIPLTLDGIGTVTDVVTDSRLAGPGALFVAIRGGHDFAADALARGAVAVLAERDVGVPAVLVPDTVAALGAIAHEVWRHGSARTYGITGSSGKTTTKDMLAQVLETQGETVAPQGSYNNEIGLPLTLFRLTGTTRHLVLEMSARGRGHIAALCAIARPDVGVVLNVGTAHLGEFGSREEIALAKREIVDAAGMAVLNAEDPLVLGMRTHAAHVVLFGEGGDYRAERVRLDPAGRPGFRLVTPDGAADVTLQFAGEHQVSNALAVAAAAGLPADVVAEALTHAVPRSRWRMEVHETAAGVTVVNDAYNANPESVRAALKTLAATGRGRRTWAVLGEMAELGEASWAEHDAIGRLCVRLDVSKLVVVGAAAKGIHAGASLEGSWGEESVLVDDADAAIALLRSAVRPGDVVLVKGSRVAGLERVAEALL